MPRGKRVRRNERGHRTGSLKDLGDGKVRAWKPPRDGRRASRLFHPPAARAKAEAWLAGLEQGPSMLLGVWLELWADRRWARLRPNTRRNYRMFAAWLADIKDRPLASLTANDWQATLDRLLATHARSSIKAARSIWSGALAAAVRAGHLDSNPLAETVLPREEEKIPPAWRSDEVRRLLAACVGDPHEAFVHLGLATGLRLGELRALVWDDVDLVGLTVTVSKALDNGPASTRGPTKSGRVRVVDLPRETADLLAECRKRQPPAQQLVLGHPGPYAAQTYRKVLRRLCRRAGVTPLTPHSLRHTFASLAIDNGVSLPELAEALGHANARITGEIYVHYVERQRKRTAKAIGGALYGGSAAEKSDLHHRLHTDGGLTRER